MEKRREEKRREEKRKEEMKRWRDGEVEKRRAEARRICHNKEKGDAKIHKSLAQDDGWSKNLLSCSCLYRLLFLFLHLIYKKGLMGPKA